jgi:hypothetical protein
MKVDDVISLLVDRKAKNKNKNDNIFRKSMEDTTQIWNKEPLNYCSTVLIPVTSILLLFYMLQRTTHHHFHVKYVRVR